MFDIIIYLILILFLGTTAYAGISAAPWLPTLKREANTMVSLANIKPGDTIYDLGCGDGRLLVATKKMYPGCKVIGIEMSLFFVIISRINLWLNRLDGKIIWGNLFKTDLKDADVVFVFLMPRIYSKLQNKLKKELKSGCRVIVNAWPIHGWEDKRVESNKKQEIIYVYKI
ncbi:MAG: class I SAM-dependent methyltransferase [Patescibacteria group bacterium]